MLSLAVLGVVLAAQTSLSCTDKLAVPVPDTMASMPGMDMAAMPSPLGHQAMMICPVVLGLIAASALLVVAAAVLWWRDPHRALLQRSFLAALADLPVVRSVAGIALMGAGAMAAMLWLERTAPPTLSGCASLAALLVVSALAATLVAIAGGRFAVVLGRRLMLAVVEAIGQAARSAPARYGEIAAPLTASYGSCLLAAGRGLRAPPLFVR